MVFLLILGVYGMGFHYNDIYRFGSIFPSDILLAVTLIYYIFIYRNTKIKKKFIYAILIAIFEFFLGLLAGNSFGNILRDFKIFLYFFAIYWILEQYCKNTKRIHKLFKYYIIVVFISIVLNIVEFFNNGLTNIESGEILRTFAIGLGWGAIVPISMIINTYRKEFCNKYGVVLYYILEIASLLCVVLSCTRTTWISLIVAFILKKIIVDKINININAIIKTAFIVLAIILVINHLYREKNPVFMVLYNRFSGISEAMSDEDSTFAYRINDVSSSFYKFESPRIIWGYGYGDTRKPFGYRMSETEAEVGCENSYFYYIWKYGIFFSILLFFSLFKKMKKIWCKSKASKVWIIYFVVYMAIDAMSGNLSSTYSIAIYALYFILATYVDEGLEEFGINNDTKVRKINE